MSERPVLERVRALVVPIASDLQLDVYDVEQRGGTLRITLDTRPGDDGQHAGIDLEQLSLATRLISRELDHTDPIPGRYTLEVSSPGVERSLRRPEHFARAIGETVSVRLVAPDAAGQRRYEGQLVAADDRVVTLLVDGAQHRLALAEIDRAKTVFEWGPAPKPGKGGPAGKQARAAAPGPGGFEGDGFEGDDIDEDDIDEEETETP